MPEPLTHFTRFFVPQVRIRPLAACAVALVLASLFPATPQQLAGQSINDQAPARVVAPPAPQLDINRATLAQLLRVHGITQSYAQRIIDGRPYSNKSQLKTKGIIPPQVYQAAKDHLVAHHIH